MTDRTAQLRTVYYVLVAAFTVSIVTWDGTGGHLLLEIALLVLMVLMWPTVRPGVRTLTTTEAQTDR